MILTASLGLGAIGSAQAATYYVRADGGTATQCTGRGDAPYPGSGSAQNCAWNNPTVALPSSGSARIAGGDTLLIGSGTYKIGSALAVPSGTSSARTRILGKPGATAPKLAGINGIHRVIDLTSRSNIELGNLDITDLSDCVYNHSNSGAKCGSGDDWARGGIYASDSRNVWIHDVDIHGLGARGIQAGGLSDWTLERVKINRNGTAGWTGDIGSGSSNSGKITMRDIEIGWNGCGERVGTSEAVSCWGQKAGGYGDGLGTASTGGQWLIEDAFIHHNTSDGLDLLYMNGADNSSVTLRRVYVTSNAGNQVKVTGNSLIENSVIVGHCTYFKGKFHMQDGDNCRAYGATLLLNMTGNDTATVRHNTLAGEGDAQIVYNNGNSSDKIQILNNVAVGFPYFVNGSKRSFSAGAAPAAKTISGNLAWNVASCPSGVTCQNPKLTNMTLAGFDAEPLAGSPVIDKAPMISAVTTDFVLGKRPTGAANDIGAYEYGAAGTAPTPDPTPTPTPDPTPAPSCSRNAPTVSVTGPTSGTPAGSKVDYKVSVRNNDGDCYTGKTFILAKTAPSGWTSSLGASSAYIASGATFSTTLSVTSPATANAGSYGIGAGVSSGAGAVHTGQGSATYLVAAPAPSCSRNSPTVSVTGPSTGATAGSTVSYKVTVRNNDDLCFTGKTFILAKTVPSGWSSSLGASSAYIASGATFSTTLNVTSPSATTAGSYGIGAGVSSGAGAVHTAQGAANYLVANAAPTCSRREPTVSVSGPTSGTAAGTRVNYKVTVRNNDDACYTGKTFILAKNVPSGWSSSLGSSSAHIASGATFSTTLSVTSPSSAKAGSYGVGTDVRSGAGAAHNASGSTSYIVK